MAKTIQEVLQADRGRRFRDRQRASTTTIDVSDAYLDAVAPQFQFARRIKVVADAGNGTAGPLLPSLLERLNCEGTELFFNMDGRFPNHHPDPTVPRISSICKTR